MPLDDARTTPQAWRAPPPCPSSSPCHCCLPCRRLAPRSCTASLAGCMQLQLHEPPLPPLCEAAEARTDRACDPGLPTPHCPAPPTTPSQTSVAEKKTAVFLVFLLFSFPRALSQTFSLQHLVFFFSLLSQHERKWVGGWVMRAKRFSAAAGELCIINNITDPGS